ncbi:MAG: hypothetical protein LWW77_09975, partial [Propionibacteriales bacterium]|nr:hypothetical protein [Propionibacteriales bacterium]
MNWASFVDAAAHLLLGARCPGCGVAGIGACSQCRSRLRRDRPVVLGVAGWPPVSVVAAGRYSGVVKGL